MQNLIIRKLNSNKIWRSIGPISRLTGNRQVHSHTGDTAVTNLLFLPWKVTTFENILFDFPSGPQTVCSDSTQVTWPKRPITVSFLCACHFEFDKNISIWLDLFTIFSKILYFFELFFSEGFDLFGKSCPVQVCLFLIIEHTGQSQQSSTWDKKKSTEEVTCLRWPFRVSECVIVRCCNRYCMCNRWGVEPFNSYVFNFSTNLNPLGRWCPLWTHFFFQSRNLWKIVQSATLLRCHSKSICWRKPSKYPVIEQMIQWPHNRWLRTFFY